MNIRRFRALHAAGATFVEIGRECGCDWRTVRRYLAEDAPAVPPTSPSRAGTQPRLIEPFVERIEVWLRSDLALKGTVIHERRVADYGFTGHYQRVKKSSASVTSRALPVRGITTRRKRAPCRAGCRRTSGRAQLCTPVRSSE